MKAFFVAGVIGLASTCLAVAIYKGALPPIELKPGNVFTPAKAMEKGSPGSSTSTRKHIGQPKYEDLKKTTKPSAGSTSGSSPTRLQK
jgi:hypothetical protein